MIGKFIRSENTLYENIDDEAVILNLGDGCYYGLNSTARELWRHLERPLTAGELRTKLHDEYPELSPEEIARDVAEFLESLKQCELIKPLEV